MQKWTSFLRKHLVDFCHRKGSRTFVLQELMHDSLDTFQAFAPNNKHVRQKICEQLQFLRNENFLTFVDKRGTYTVHSIDLLQDEQQEMLNQNIVSETPERREYVIELFVRKVRWAQEARRVLGESCLFERCTNSFMREDKTPYIEVHHIIPLHKGGADAVWNLAVLCAHHHCMAHYASRIEQQKIQTSLQHIVDDKLKASV